MKKVLVKWNDITHDSGWHDMDEVDKFINDDDNIVYQIGFLYESDEDQIVLLDSYFEKKELFGTIHKIPKGCILDIRELTYI